MKRFLIALIAAGLLAVPAAASASPTGSTAAAPVLWSGFGGTSTLFIRETLVLKTSAGKVSIKTLQSVMNCTDRSDGRVNKVAFSVYNNGVRATMRRNRFVINTTAVSTGRLAAVHISGTLGSNGRGSARLRLLGNSRDSNTGELLEECEREVTIQMRRGPRPR
jgi:hypothetical protein